jgi:PAS domain-containing protein
VSLVETEELQRRIGALEAENARLRELAIDDNTELERAETALADSEQRYRTLFESMDEGFCIIEFLDGPTVH